VALPVPANGGVFTYRLAEGTVEPGRRVLVPLGRRKATGVVLGPASAVRGELLDVLRVLDEQPLLPPDVLHLVRWAAAHYLSPLGLAIRGALPPGIDLREELRATLTPEGEALLDGARQRALLPASQEAGTRTRQLLRAVQEGRALRPAQLRWDGPERVKAGDAFNVALKVTSGQALRAVPLQLSFDAALLEPLGVRPGGLFAGGLFSYRINPAGSIFVGASGKGAVAADADILVVTFKPLRPGETELKISSMHLQSAAGSAIAHDQPAAFRTAITQ